MYDNAVVLYVLYLVRYFLCLGCESYWYGAVCVGCGVVGVCAISLRCYMYCRWLSDEWMSEWYKVVLDCGECIRDLCDKASIEWQTKLCLYSTGNGDYLVLCALCIMVSHAFVSLYIVDGFWLRSQWFFFVVCDDTWFVNDTMYNSLVTSPHGVLLEIERRTNLGPTLSL